jgi:CDP-paratose 2-epimerase
VRDVLNVDDLVRCYELAVQHRDKVSGRAFNIGGGPENTLSLLELIAMLEHRLGRKIPLRFSDWRPGDQPVFVCDLQKAMEVFSWRPETTAENGVSLLFNWVSANRNIFASA